jgi:hypothetical protein
MKWMTTTPTKRGWYWAMVNLTQGLSPYMTIIWFVNSDRVTLHLPGQPKLCQHLNKKEMLQIVAWQGPLTVPAPLKDKLK